MSSSMSGAFPQMQTFISYRKKKSMPASKGLLSFTRTESAFKPFTVHIIHLRYFIYKAVMLVHSHDTKPEQETNVKKYSFAFYHKHSVVKKRVNKNVNTGCFHCPSKI